EANLASHSSLKSRICSGEVGSVTRAEWQAAIDLPSRRKLSAPKRRYCLADGALAPAAQARVGLEQVDQRHEIVKAQDPLELEAVAVFGRPDHVGFDPADLRQANGHPLAASHARRALGHEAVRRQV